MVQRSKALHRSDRGVTTDPGSISGCITTGRDRESHRAAHNLPSIIRVRGGYGWRGLLGSSCSRDSLFRAGCLQAYLGHQVNSVSSYTFGVWVKQAGVKKCGFAGHVSEDDSTFTSRACWSFIYICIQTLYSLL